MTIKMVQMFYLGRRQKRCDFNGGRTRTRTLDPLIKSYLITELVRLSENA